MKTLLTLIILFAAGMCKAQQTAEISREIESIEFITADTTVIFKFKYEIDAGELGVFESHKSSAPVKLPEELDSLSTQEKNYLKGTPSFPLASCLYPHAHRSLSWRCAYGPAAFVTLPDVHLSVEIVLRKCAVPHA